MKPQDRAKLGIDERTVAYGLLTQKERYNKYRREQKIKNNLAKNKTKRDAFDVGIERWKEG